MYFVLVEPAWWSLGEEAAGLVFYPPTGDLPTDADGDGIWTGGVPRYVEATLTIADPKHKTGERVFGQRIAIPAGGVP